MSSADQLQRFSFDGTNIRGEIAHLNDSYREVLARHQYPAVIARAVGELMAATALMSGSLKFAGRLTLQVRLTGSVSLLQAETNEQGQLRAIARYDEQLGDDELDFANGQLVITIEPEQGQRYQGITAIEGNHIGQALSDYFEQSEQLGSRFWLMCDGHSAAGFMLQKMPAAKEEDPDAWDRLTHLASTIKEEELLQLASEQLLHRLYHEEDVRVYPASALSFLCTCSQERIANALHQLGYEELQGIIAEQGNIAINCEFCQQLYRFEQHDVEQLFPERQQH
ncbi:redox-regulated molecular chaperone Hsp33 [Bacterioplanes sanyensis]|uniref:33 kDa chaperonin n=1 Tax=Bacterioplanes sanyensis TaxID=1249553 RepID=A0A222FGC9_9GAMM|nr:Hsp33 family molecular chaperone HslO [Bacterioplanes sanyensis]ASP37789.1 redox-regulated molecular chaperone Hsp33 [Bacterioplanes sanyensis]